MSAAVPLAGFQVSVIGRFWVSPEGEAVGQLLEYSFWPGCQALPDWSSSVKPRWTTTGRSTSLGPNNSSLVDGDPLTNITDTRNIVGVWKDGARIER